MRLRALAVAAVSAAVLAPAASAAGAVVVGAPVTIDGPSADVVSLGGVALAQDGSGAIVYLKNVGGVPHVFASLETAGAWAAGVEVDAAAAAAASAPSVAVAAGGRVAVVWISAGTLYGAVRAAAATVFTAPQAIAAASGTPALGMGVSGTAYVAYAEAGAVGVARLDRSSTSFTVQATPESATPITLVGGPTIAVAADATAVVGWTQQMPDGTTHVFVRRASAAGPSPVLVDATVPVLDNIPGGSADSVSVGVAFDSSDAWVAFREAMGGFSRVVVEELLGDELRPAVFADSLAAGPTTSAAVTPSLAIDGNNQGLLASALVPSNGLAVAALGTPKQPYTWTLGSALATSTVAPAPLAALSASGRGVVAYAPAAGALDALLLNDGTATGPFPLTSTAAGVPLAGAGLDASADVGGDVVVAYVTSGASGRAIVAVPIVVAPGAPRATGTQLWTADTHPVLRWQPSADLWTRPTYAVYVDGTRVATTTQTSYSTTLPDGQHSWRVVAVDAFGQSASSRTRRLLIDSAPPVVHLAIAGRHVHHPLRFTVSATAPSGVHAVSIDYGDGHSATALSSTHAYAHPGSYHVSVAVTDGAGVTGTLRETVTIR